VAPSSVVGSGGDITTVGQGICGTTTGCVAVYVHDVDDEDHNDDGDHDNRTCGAHNDNDHHHDR
jgi:hypothetical protein